MNALTIIVLAVIALCAYGGYRQGFLRVVYSLLGGILVLGFVVFSAPYITQYLKENTQIQDTIRKKSIAYIEESAGKEMENSGEEKKDESQEFLLKNNILLPETIVEDITQSAISGTEELLERSGIYESIAESISDFILEGISFFVAFVVASIVLRSLVSILDIVSHLPVVEDVNRALGTVAGGIKGLLIVWLAFYLLALFITNEFASQIFTYVQESPILLFLYENNLLLQVIMVIFRT